MTMIKWNLWPLAVENSEYTCAYPGFLEDRGPNFEIGGG